MLQKGQRHKRTFYVLKRREGHFAAERKKTQKDILCIEEKRKALCCRKGKDTKGHCMYRREEKDILLQKGERHKRTLYVLKRRKRHFAAERGKTQKNIVCIEEKRKTFFCRAWKDTKGH